MADRQTTDASGEEGDRDPSAAGRDRRKIGGGALPSARRVAAWLGGLAAALLVLYLAAAVALRALVPPETLARWAEPRAEAALNRDVEIGGAGLSVFPHLGLVLDDVTVGNLEGFDGPPLARVERAELRVALWPLVRGDVVVDEAAARGLDVRLQVDEEGRSNFGDLLPASEDPEPGAGPGPLPVSVAVRRVSVEQSRVEYRDRRTGRRLLLQGLRASGSLTPSDGGWRATADADADDFTAALPSVREAPFRSAAVAARLRARAGPEFRWLAVEEGTVEVGGVPLSLTGRIDSLRSPVRRLSLTLESDSLGLGSLAGPDAPGTLPDAVRALDGAASLRLGVTGPAGGGRAPAVSGVLRIRGAGATVAGRGRVAGGLSGAARLRDDTVAVEVSEGTVLGGPFRLTATLGLDSARAFAGRLESTVSLSALSPAGSAGAAAGTVEAALDFSGHVRRPGATAARGTVELREVLLPADSPRAALRLPRGRLRFEGRAVTWSDLPVLVGGDSAATDGRVERWGGFLADGGGVPAVTARLEASRLDLGHLLPPSGDAPTYGQLVFASLRRDSVAGRSAAEWAAALGYGRPSRLPAAGVLEVAVDSLVYRPYRFRPATARLEFGPELIRMTGAQLGLFGGRLEQSLTLSLGGAAEQPFSVELSATGIRAADFLAASSPLGRRLSGTLDLDLTAAGRLDEHLLPARDSLVGRGRLAIADGGLTENPLTGAVADLLSYPPLRSPTVDEMSVPFRLRRSSVHFDTARMATSAGDLEWAGVLDLDGTLDLGARLAVARSRLPELSLRGAGLAGEALARLRQGDGPLSLGLRIGGTVASPRVSLDTEALRAGAQAAARRAAEDEIRQRIEQGRGLLERRAKGLLRRLAGGSDSAAADTAPGAADREPPPVDTAGSDATPDSAAAAGPPGRLNPRTTGRRRSRLRSSPPPGARRHPAPTGTPLSRTLRRDRRTRRARRD